MKLRLRTMLSVVAAIALALAAWSFGERRGRLMAEAERYDRLWIQQRAALDQIEAKLAQDEYLATRPVPRSENDTDERYQARVARWARLRSRLPSRSLVWQASEARKKADGLAALRDRCRRAADRPWLIGGP